MRAVAASTFLGAPNVGGRTGGWFVRSLAVCQRLRSERKPPRARWSGAAGRNEEKQVPAEAWERTPGGADPAALARYLADTVTPLWGRGRGPGVAALWGLELSLTDLRTREERVCLFSELWLEVLSAGLGTPEARAGGAEWISQRGRPRRAGLHTRRHRAGPAPGLTSGWAGPRDPSGCHAPRPAGSQPIGMGSCHPSANRGEARGLAGPAMALGSWSRRRRRPGSP